MRLPVLQHLWLRYAAMTLWMVHVSVAISSVGIFVASGWSQESTAASGTDDEPSSANPDKSVHQEPHSLLPYRRVFVPGDDVESIGINNRDYTILDKKRLEEFLGPFRTDRMGSERQSQPVEVQASTYIARLVGPTLVSNASRIEFSRGSVVAERIRLQPWSLALSNGTIDPGIPWNDANGTSGAMRRSRWGFDEKGNPLIDLHRDEPSLAADPLSVGFSWVLNSLPDSSPTQLQFQADLPRVFDSCMLLTLPPQSMIVDANVAAIEVKDWGAIEKRLTSWSEIAKAIVDRQRIAGSSDSLWLLELGGTERVRFTISMKPSGADSSSAKVGRDSAGSLDHLVLQQRVEHSVDDAYVKSRCTMEIAWDRQANNRTIRFQLPNNSRLAKLSLAEVDLDWRFEDGWVVCSEQILKALNPKEGKITLLAELLTDEPSSTTKDSTGASSAKWQLPALQIDRSYVLSGLTAITVQPGSRLTYLTTSNGRFVPDSSSTTPVATTQLEWWDQIPAVGIEVSNELVRDNVQIATKYSDNDGIPRAVVRLTNGRPFRADQLFEVEEGWSVQDVVPSDSKRPVAIEPIALEGTSHSQFRIARDSLATAGRSIDVTIVPIKGKENGAIAFPPGGWVRFSNSQASSTGLFVVENLTNVEELPTQAFSQSVSIDSIPSFQSSLITGPERAWAWSVDPDDRFELKTRMVESIVGLSLHTSLDRVGERVVRWKQQLTLTSPLQDPLVVRLSPVLENNVRWSIPSENGTSRYFDPVTKGGNSTLPTTVWLSPSSFPQESRTIIFEQDIQLAEANVASIPLPMFENAQVLAWTAAVDSELWLEQVESDRWQIDPSGRRLLRIQPERESLKVGIAERIIPVKEDASPLVQATASYDILVDSNEDALAQCTVAVSGSIAYSSGVVFQLKDDWILDAASVQLNKGANVASAYSIEQNVLMLRPTSGFHRNSGAGILSTGLESGVHSREPIHSAADDATIELAFLCRRDGRAQGGSVERPLAEHRISLPQLAISDKLLPTSGRLWVPAAGSTLTSTKKLGTTSDLIPWQGFDWWQQSVASLFGRKESASRSATVSSAMADSPSGLGPMTDWVLLEEWSSESNRQSIVLRAIEWSRNFQLSLLLISTLLGAWSIRRLWIGGLALAGVAVLFYQLNNPFVAPAIPYVMSGLVFGACMNALYRLVPIAATQDPTTSASGPGQSWEGTGPLAGKVSSVKQGVYTALFWLMISSTVNAQSAKSDGGFIAPYDLVFPMDSESGSWKQDQVYVPTSLFNATRGLSGASHTLLHAKHQLRLGTRTRPLTAVDQLVLSYDFWIGTPGTPIEFPLGGSLSSLNRFTVDESEVAFGRTLRRIEGGVAWVPDKPGKQTVQLLITPLFINGSPESSIGGVINQSFELPIVPAGNATLELDADPTLQVDIDSLGGTTNPAPGRYLVSLGNVSKLQCRLRYSPTGGAATAVANPNPVTMSTEYLMQQSILRAKTVIRVPKGSSFERRFEMEADSPWQPLNTSWDNAKLVEVRGASSLSRRRYVFEWNAPSEIADDVSVAILWVLRDNSVNALNALFAECLDRRVRHSTLRFARLSGADWNIEQVNTWIPAINERERLDWPELASINKSDASNTAINPRVTSLRVPLNGGFGILRKSLKQERLQARIASRWTVSPRLLSLSTRIELLGAPVSDVLELVLPSGYVVTEARHRLGDFRVFQQSMVQPNGMAFERVQLLAERLLWENADISLRAEKPIEKNAESFEVPWMNIPYLPTVDQTLELAATDSWMVQISDSVNGERSLVGRGVANSIATLNRSDAVRFTRRVQPVSMRFELELHPRSDSDRYDLDFQVMSRRNEGAVPFVVIQIPASYADYWRCDRPSSMIPCPIRDTVWIQVELAPSNEDSQWTLSLDISEQDLAQLVAQPNQIRIVNEFAVRNDGTSLTELLASISPAERNAAAPTTSLENVSQDGWVAWHSLLPKNNPADGTTPHRILESRFWILQTVSGANISAVQWTIPPGTTVEEVLHCGSPAVWDLHDNTLSLPGLACLEGYMSEVAIRTRISGDATSITSLPALVPNDRFPKCSNVVGWDVAPDSPPDSITPWVPYAPSDELTRCLAIVRKGMQTIPPSAERGSHALRWLAYWAHKTRSLVGEVVALDGLNPQHNEMESTRGLLVSETRELLKIVGERLEVDKLSTTEISSSQQLTITAGEPKKPLRSFSYWLYILFSLLSLMGVIAVSRLPNKRPWWNLLALGSLGWIVTGWMVVAIVFSVIALIVAADTFLINRAYQAATRLKRSLP